MATVSIVLLLAIATTVSIRFSTLRIWHLLLAGAFGFYLNDSSMGPWLGDVMGTFFDWVGSKEF
jgi:hypothetical protein